MAVPLKMGIGNPELCGHGHCARLAPSPGLLHLPRMSSKSVARLQLRGAAFLFSTGGAAIKAADFTGWQIASIRSGIAAVALWLMTPAARRGWTRWGALVGV